MAYNSNTAIEICLECGRIGSTCGCENSVRVSRIDDVTACSCGKYAMTYDIVRCDACAKQLCIRCQWESLGYKCYCESCAEICNCCGQKTEYYKGFHFACRRCGEVLCVDCLSSDLFCAECTSGSNSELELT